MATIENTIATLEAKLKQAKAKKMQIEARKRALCFARVGSATTHLTRQQRF